MEPSNLEDSEFELVSEVTSTNEVGWRTAFDVGLGLCFDCGVTARRAGLDTTDTPFAY